MLEILAGLALFTPALDTPAPPKLTLDPLGRAAHASSLCDCPQPLADYLTYSLTPQLNDAPPAPTQAGGVEHVALMAMINERWGHRYELAAYDTTTLDPAYVDAWHAWVEDVQTVHGVPPSYVHAAGAATRDWKDGVPPHGPNRTPTSTDILLRCENCVRAACDAQRLAMRARQAIHNGVYREECSDGCASPEDEMRTRLIDMVFDIGPVRPGGWTFKIVAAEEPEAELRLVHGKITPTWGVQIEISIPPLDVVVPVLSMLRGYKVHILKADGTWMSWPVDLNQPSPATYPPGFPYRPCHPFFEDNASGGAAGFSDLVGGCYVQLPRPMP